jgi:hypothetical protein
MSEPPLQADEMAGATMTIGVLAFTVRPDEPTRTSENNCLYEAEAELVGKRYSARSRRGAPFALARVLVAAGVPDQPVMVTHEGLRVGITYRSLHRMAELTIEESARSPVRDVRYREYPGREDERSSCSEHAGDGPVFGAVSHGGEPENGGSAAPRDVRLVSAPALAECGACGRLFRPLLAEVQATDEASSSNGGR